MQNLMLIQIIWNDLTFDHFLKLGILSMATDGTPWILGPN